MLEKLNKIIFLKNNFQNKFQKLLMLKIKIAVSELKVREKNY